MDEILEDILIHHYENNRNERSKEVEFYFDEGLLWGAKFFGYEIIFYYMFDAMKFNHE